MGTEQKVAVITGASQGIGAGLVKAFRDRNYRVVANSRSIKPASDEDILTAAGDIADPATAKRLIAEGLERFGRIDTLVNNAGIFIAKRFTNYTEAEFAAVVSTNLAGFFHITQRAIEAMERQGSGHIVNITTSLVNHANSAVPSVLASLTKGGLDSGDQVARDRVRQAGHSGECRRPGDHQDADACAGRLRGLGQAASGGPHGRDLGHRGRGSLS